MGIFLDFVWLTTRTPHGAYVRRARRNRIDRHGGEIERLATRTQALEPAEEVDLNMSSKKSGSTFQVGIFLDCVRPTTRTMHPVGRTCGGPGEIELTPIGVKVNGSRRVRR